VLPSWGASWYDGTAQYLDDMQKDLLRRRRITLGKPWLMGISAGGPKGFQLYDAQPQRFAGYVSVASTPPLVLVRKMKPELRILMLNGKLDKGFRPEHAQWVADQLSPRLPHFQLHLIDADHFLMLSKREETFRAIKDFMQKEGGKPGQ
jgi:pimeloyl-ACP methyl ester carboxylesterase